MIGRAGVFTFRPAGKDLAIRISGLSPRTRPVYRSSGPSTRRADAAGIVALWAWHEQAKPNEHHNYSRRRADQPRAVQPAGHRRESRDQVKARDLVFTRYAFTRSLR